MKRSDIAPTLGRRLAGRLYPVALLIGFLLSTGLPAVHYLLGYTALRQTALSYAQELAWKIERIATDTPDLWKYQVEKYAPVLQEFVAHKEVFFLKVLDEEKRAIPQYGYTTGRGNGWWIFKPVVGSAPVLLQGRKVGTVEIFLSQTSLLKVTLSLLALSAVVGVSLAVLAYLFPVRVVGTMEGEVHRLLRDVQQKSQELEVLVKVNRDIASLLDKKTLLTRIAEEARTVLRMDAAIFRLLEGEELVLAATTDIKLGSFRSRLRFGESLSGKIVEENRAISIRDVLEDDRIIAEHRETLHEAGYRSFLGLPLRLGDRVIGTINVYSKRERDFSEEEIRLMGAFADQAAIAVENSRLFEEVREKSGELEKANQELLSAYRAKSAFLNTMAHELKTPLNAVLGLGGLLSEGCYGEINDKQRKAMETVERNVRALIGLIDEILELARLEARGAGPLLVEEFSLKEMVEELDSTFGPLARKKGIELRFALEDSDATVRTDRMKVKQILENLLSNAVKYTDRGWVECSVSIRDEAQKRLVSFFVRDSGMGLKEEEKGRIFEPFYMASGVDRAKHPGTGLGLTIVKRLVEALRGEISVESRLGEGSTFTVTVPLSHQ